METIYRGKLISEMSKEELIEALKQMGSLYTQELEQHYKNLV